MVDTPYRLTPLEMKGCVPVARVCDEEFYPWPWIDELFWSVKGTLCSLGLIEVGLSSNADEGCGSKEDDVPYLLWIFKFLVMS